MSFKSIFFVLAVCLHWRFIVSTEDVKSYRGYQVWRLALQSLEQATFAKAMELEENFDFWSGIRIGVTSDVLVPPHQIQVLQDRLAAKHIDHSIMIDDVQSLIDQTGMGGAPPKDGLLDLNIYHSLEEIYQWFDNLENEFSYITSEIIGQSLEGRDMRVLKVCQGGCGNKPIMWIQSGIHAREWISPAVACFMINMLSQDLSPNDQDLLDNLDWYFLVSTNPDGYAFTQTTDRLWRKTRSNHDGDGTCMGVDPNRNFGVGFGGQGTSTDPCSNIFRGPDAFSEVETRNVRDFVLSHKDDIIFYHDMHSYTQLVLLPYGFKADLPQDYDILLEFSLKANIELLSIHGMIYDVGNLYDTIYPASGNAVDWGYDPEGAGVKYTISLELRDTGRYGFLLPPDQIIPCGQEVWAFHASFARSIVEEELGGSNSK